MQDRLSKLELQKSLRNLERLFSETTVFRWVLVALIFIAAILFVPTLAEFIVSLHNRYRTYSQDFETSMLAKSIGLSGVFSLAAAFLVGYSLKIMTVRWYWVLAALCLSAVMCMIDSGTFWADFLAIPATVIFLLTVGLSFYSKTPFLVAAMGFIIMLLARPSMLPDSWCKYELTMYSCDSVDVFVSPTPYR